MTANIIDEWRCVYQAIHPDVNAATWTLMARAEGELIVLRHGTISPYASSDGRRVRANNNELEITTVCLGRAIRVEGRLILAE